MVLSTFKFVLNSHELVRLHATFALVHMSTNDAEQLRRVLCY